MTHVVKDRVRETTTTTGTGFLTLLGAVLGFQPFSAIGDGNTTYYTVVHTVTGDWETGIGTYTSPNYLARTTIISSSNSNSPVNFIAGSKDVYCSLPAAKAVVLGPTTSILSDGITQWGAANSVGSFTGLVYSYLGGVAISLTGVISKIANGTTTLSDNSVNYVERTLAGVVSSNTAGFTVQTKVPMAKVTTASGAITAVDDWRSTAGPFSLNKSGQIAITYSTAIAIDVTTGDWAIIIPTDGVAFAIAAPTGSTDGYRLTCTVRNTFGTLGTGTWNAVFKMAAWVQPANGFSRSITFRYDGATSKYIEVSRTMADIPN